MSSTIPIFLIIVLNFFVFRRCSVENQHGNRRRFEREGPLWR